MSRGASQTADRLVAALGDLLSREAIEALAGAGLRVRALQARISPLVTALSDLASDPAEPQLAGAIGKLVEKRKHNQALMQESLARMRRELDGRGRALERLRRVRPVYGRQNAVATRLNAAS